MLEQNTQTIYGRLDAMSHSEKWIKIFLNGGFWKKLKISEGIQDEELIALWGKMVQAKAIDDELIEINLITW